MPLPLPFPNILKGNSQPADHNHGQVEERNILMLEHIGPRIISPISSELGVLTLWYLIVFCEVYTYEIRLQIFMIFINIYFIMHCHCIA